MFVIVVVFIYLSPFILLGLGVAYVVGRRFNQPLIAGVAGAIAGVLTQWVILFAVLWLYSGTSSLSGSIDWQRLAAPLAFFSVPVAFASALVAVAGRTPRSSLSNNPP